jgi:hypothetical protein
MERPALSNSSNPDEPFPQLRDLGQIAARAAAASTLLLILGVWSGHQSERPFIAWSVSWSLPFVGTAIALQIAGYALTRWDLLGGVFLQSVASALVLLWALGLVITPNPLDVFWPTFEAWGNGLAVLLMARQAITRPRPRRAT